MEQLTGLDATFLYLETPSLHMHVSMAAMFDPSTVPGGYSFDKVRDLVSSRLELAPIFRRRLVEVPLRLGHPYWVDDPTFDIDYHIRRGAVPAPGGVEELAQFVGDVCSRQLDRTKPLWEMYIVEGLRGGQIAVVTKIHHCTIDGVSGAELLSQLFDLEPDPPARPGSDAPLTFDDHLPSDLQLLAQSLGTRMMRPLGLTKLAWRTSRALLDVRRVRARGAGWGALPLTTPRTSLNASITPHRRVAFSSISLEDAKRVKKACDTTLNDVVLAVCTGALRRYLIDGDGGDENLKDYPIEENPELTITSVIHNQMLYQEGWGVGKIKHSLTYSGGLSRSYTRTYAPAHHYGFSGFSPYTRPDVIAVAEGIPFIKLTEYDVNRLYELKGEIVSRGVAALTGLAMPIFPKRRFQHGALSVDALHHRLPYREAEYRKQFLSLYQ